MFANRTIKWKLVLIITSTSVASLLIASMAFLFYRMMEMRQEMVADYQTHAGILSKSLSYAIEFNVPADARDTLSELKKRKEVLFAEVLDQNGERFAHYQRIDLPKNYPPPSYPNGAPSFGRSDLTLCHPIFIDDKQVGQICIQVGLDRLKRARRHTIQAVALVLLASAAMAFLLATRMQGLISGPILELTKAATRIGRHKDYSTQVPKTQDDELGRLIDAFNHMLHQIKARDADLVTAKEHLEKSSKELEQHRDQLEQEVEERTVGLKSANDELRAFTFMFSHDLRTPLVNIKGFTGELRHGLEIINKHLAHQVEQLDEPERTQILATIKEDIPEALAFIECSAGNMDRLIKALSKLSYLGRRELAIARIDMQASLDRVLENLAHRMEQNEVSIQRGPMPDVHADRTSIEQILENILTNAVDYLRQDRPGLIEIWGEQGQDATFFYIRDNGRGIALADLPNVFEPLRSGGPKSTADQGMGLAYTRALVGRHGGKIWCTSKLNEGSTFIFTIAKNPRQGVGSSNI